MVKSKTTNPGWLSKEHGYFIGAEAGQLSTLSTTAEPLLPIRADFSYSAARLRKRYQE